MKFVEKNSEYVAVFHLPDSTAGNTVTYAVYKSDGTTVETGSATHITGDKWMVQFTPVDDAVYSIEVDNTTLDQQRSEIIVTTTLSLPTIDIGSEFNATFEIPESSSGDTVTFVVYLASDGSTVTSGSMTNIGGSSWKAAFTPVVAGVHVIEATKDDFTYVDVITAAAAATTSDDEPTAQEMLTELNKAINKRLTGGGVNSYSIGGRNLQYMSLTEMRALRRELKSEVASGNGGARNFADQKVPT